MPNDSVSQDNDSPFHNFDRDVHQDMMDRLESVQLTDAGKIIPTYSFL